MWASLTRLAVLTGVFLATGGTAVAQSPIAGGDLSISFDEAVARTLESNPELRAFGYSIAAQQGRIEQAKQPPPVELDVEIENILGTGIYSGVQSSQTTIGLVWSLERGKRQHRVAASEAGLTAIESEADLLRLDKAAETAHRYFETLALQARIELAVEATRLAATTVDAVEQRVSAGRTPLADLARAKVELARREMEHEHLSHLHLTSIHRLAAQWGETSPAFASVSGDLADLPVVDTFEELMARTGQNPQMRRLLNEQRLREAELRRAESEARLDWQVLAGARHLEDTNDQNFVALFRIPFGGEKRNAGNVARAQANLDRNGADRIAARIKVETELFALYSELKHSLEITETLRDRVLPNVDIALSETQRAYEAGRYSYLELRIAQDEALRAREDYLNALIETHHYAIGIESLTGTALSSPVHR